MSSILKIEFEKLRKTKSFWAIMLAKKKMEAAIPLLPRMILLFKLSFFDFLFFLLFLFFFFRFNSIMHHQKKARFLFR